MISNLDIIAIMEKHGWDQTDLAQRLGISQSSVSRLVSGKIKPGAQTMLKLARLKGLSVDESALSLPSEEEYHVALQALGRAFGLEVDQTARLVEVIEAVLNRQLDAVSRTAALDQKRALVQYAVEQYLSAIHKQLG